MDSFNEQLVKEKLLNSRHISASGCWEWTRNIKSSGYGSIRVPFHDKRRNNDYNVHRLAYYLWVDKKIDGLFVCHKCDNRKCFNPEHLFLGTHSDNMQDMVAKGRDNAPIHYGNNFAGMKVLADFVEYPSYVAAGKALGISDNGVRKRIKLGWLGYSKID